MNAITLKKTESGLNKTNTQRLGFFKKKKKKKEKSNPNSQHNIFYKPFERNILWLMKWVSKSKRQIWSMIASVKTTGTCFNFFVWRHLITQFLVWYAGTAKQQYLFNQSHTLKTLRFRPFDRNPITYRRPPHRFLVSQAHYCTRKKQSVVGELRSGMFWDGSCSHRRLISGFVCLYFSRSPLGPVRPARRETTLRAHNFTFAYLHAVQPWKRFGYLWILVCSWASLEDADMKKDIRKQKRSPKGTKVKIPLLLKPIRPNVVNRR